MKLAIQRIVLGGILVWLVRVAGASGPFPDVSQLPSRLELADPLVMFNGDRVTTKEQWFSQRRPELKALFQHYMYGQMPPRPPNLELRVGQMVPPRPPRLEFKLERLDGHFLGGKATKKEVAIRFGPTNTPCLHLLLVVPNARTKPVPVFLGLNFCGNHTVVNDPAMPLPAVWMPNSCRGCTNNQATDSSRGTQVATWNIEQSVDRGYAVATFYNGDIEPDHPGAAEGVRAYYRGLDTIGGTTKAQSYDWGAIAAWAWGFHRAVDYLVTDKDIDKARIAAVGHSRNGKAALVAAAFDERISLVIPLQAGCGGTAPSRGKIGESVKQINDRFPHWFNDQFKKFNAQVDRLPFDQHFLVALVAPRPVLFPNAIEDTWANPQGQFEMLQAADPVYRFLGAGGLDAKQMPEPGRLVDSMLGYYIRPGKHSMTSGDWRVFLDFADKHFLAPAPRK